MEPKEIKIRGARENNLKNINVDIPKNKLVVITGLSGSGKSSLAFDTIYAEGRRRYMESLSSYARQFLGQIEKPAVDSIEGLSPSISIDQKTTVKNPRSTVGTVTEIYDYLRLLYSSIGTPHCPICNKEIKKQTIDQIVDRIMKFDEGTKIQILSPIIRNRKGEHIKIIDQSRKNGFVRARIDGTIHDLSEEIKLEKNKKHTIEIVVDRLIIKDSIKSRLSDSIETASSLSGGIIVVNIINGEDIMFSQNYACPEHGISIGEMQPSMFSFNSPFGACKKCTGLGVFINVDPSLIIPNKTLSINEGGIRASGWSIDENSISMSFYKALSKKYNFSLDTKLKDLPKSIIDILLYGTKDEMLNIKRKTSKGIFEYETAFEGVVNNLNRRYKETQSKFIKEDIEKYMSFVPCPDCKGKRLSKESLSVTVGGLNIYNFCSMSISDSIKFIENISLTEKEFSIAKEILKEIKERLHFLKNVGLDYLTLSRESGTLSGGESQRIRLATQIGSFLTGVIYILDEPSIGLHQRDNDKLLDTLKKLRDIGNTVIVVEHDEDTMKAADYIVDIGPMAGKHGGEVVCCGTIDKIKKCKNSITGQYLSGTKKNRHT